MCFFLFFFVMPECLTSCIVPITGAGEGWGKGRGQSVCVCGLGKGGGLLKEFPTTYVLAHENTVDPMQLPES